MANKNENDNQVLDLRNRFADQAAEEFELSEDDTKTANRGFGKLFLFLCFLGALALYVFWPQLQHKSDGGEASRGQQADASKIKTSPVGSIAKARMTLMSKVNSQIGAGGVNGVSEVSKQVQAMLSNDLTGALRTIKKSGGEAALEKTVAGDMGFGKDLIGQVMAKSSGDSAKVPFLRQQAAITATGDIKQSLGLYKAAATKAENDARLWLDLGQFAMYQGDNTLAQSAFEKVKQVARTKNDTALQETANLAMSSLMRDSGNVKGAKELLTQTLKGQIQRKDFAGAALTSTNLGVIAQKRGKFQRAKGYFSDAHNYYETNKDRSGVAHSLSNLGVLAWRERDYNKARDYFSKSTQIEKSLGNQVALARNSGYLGQIDLINGNISGARTHLLNAVKLDKELGHKAALARHYSALGKLEMDQKRYKEAETWLVKAQDVEQESQNKRGLVKILGNLGLLYGKMGQLDKAASYYSQSGAMAKSVGATAGVATSHGNLGVLAQAKGDVASACGHWAKARTLFETSKLKDHVTMVDGWIKGLSCLKTN